MNQAETKHLLNDLIREIETLPAAWQVEFKQWLKRLSRRYQQGKAIDRSLAKLKSSLRQQQQAWQARKQGLPTISLNQALPIYQRREEIIETIQQHQVVVIAGETGSGKTTQLPQLCLQAGRGLIGKIGHTQPRRIATRAVASRIAEELACKLGEQVGYQVRFDKRVGDDAYLKVMTDGVLLNELHDDPLLTQYDTLIIDEAHERSLNIDFILGLLKAILPKRPDLTLIITSATIDLEKFSAHFDNAPIIEVSGRTYPVEVRYRTELEYPEAENQEQLALQAARELLNEGPGDILLFLPTEQMIRHTADYFRKHLPRSIDILPLYSRLAQQQQMQIFSQHSRTRIVLSTNIAETSLTVPGISYVIDTGLARLSRYSTRSKIQRLPIENISQASANQRMGRCGRTHEGICIRLYSEDDFNSRPEFTEPEILRTNLATVILQMAQLELGAVEIFDFIDPPEQKQINDGVQLLRELGAMTDSREITPMGRQLARLPVDPRIGRILLAGAESGALKQVTIIAAAVGIQDPRERPVEKQQAADEQHRRFIDKRSDFVALLNLWDYFHDLVDELSWSKVRQRCLQEFIHFQRMREWREQVAQLHQIMRNLGYEHSQDEASYEAIHKAILSGFLTQIGCHDPKGYYLAPRQTKVYLFPGSGLYQKNSKDQPGKEQSETLSKQKAAWIMAAELVETSKNFARLVAKVQPDWIEQAAKPLLKIQYSEPFWSQKAGRAMVRESGLLYGLTIYSGRRKNLSDFDKQEARTWFIENALLERAFKTRSKLLKNNWNVQDEAEQIQDRERRRDLVVNRDWFLTHYQKQLPEHIHNAAGFERWVAKLPNDHAFTFKLDDISSVDMAEQQSLFPDVLVVNQLALSVRYQFQPGLNSDGMHIEIPLLALNKVSATDFQWLVPGLYDELLIALIRGLPKVKRKQFVPVPEYARALKETLHKTEVPLYRQIASALQKMSGQLMSVEDFEAVELPLNLQPNYRVVDEQGEILAESRDLAHLQQRFKQQLKQQLSTDKEKREFQSFPEQGFKPQSVVRHGDTDITTYQGLRKTDQGYLLEHTDSEQEMATWHQQAVLSMILKDTTRLQREMKDYIHELSSVELVYSTLGDATVEEISVQTNSLYADLVVMTAKQQYTQLPECHSPEAYADLLAAVRANALPDALAIQSILETVFKTSREIRKQIDKPRDIRLLETAKTIQQRLYELLFKGFINHSSPEIIRHYPRYLKGLIQRLHSAQEKPVQARERSITWDKYWHKYVALEPSLRSIELRQMLEEFHVMIFAQQLGTRMKVSEKRLDEQFKKL